MNAEFPMLNTTLCYLEQDGKWLMLHRVTKKNDMNHDKWIGVGGKFERFESPEDCLLREVREETGLTLTNYRLRGIVTFLLGSLLVQLDNDIIIAGNDQQGWGLDAGKVLFCHIRSSATGDDRTDLFSRQGRCFDDCGTTGIAAKIADGQSMQVRMRLQPFCGG